MDDYQRLFARYRVILLIAVLLGAAVALALSAAQSASYSTTASLQVQDLIQIEGIVGGVTGSSLQQPAQLSAATARSVTSDAVLRRALSQLPGSTSVKALRSDTSASVDPASGLLLISARAPTAQRAAARANAIASSTADVVNAQMRAQFAGYARVLQARIAQIPNTRANATIRDRDQTNLSRLQTLAIVGEPVTISQRGDVPTSGTSRRIGFNVLLGAVLGLIFGLAVAAVRELLDRTVHTPDDVRTRLGLPIVGHVADTTLGSAPYQSANPSAAERAAIARFGVLRRSVELLGSDTPPRTVLVTSPAPQDGKTTVALSLASAFTAVGRRALLIEADMRRPVLAERLGLRVAPGLAEYLRGESSLQDATQAVTLPAGASLACLLAGTATKDADAMFASERWRSAVTEMGERFEVLVIDAPPLISAPDALEMLTLVDAYLVCVRAGRTRLAQLEAAKEMLERLPSRPAGVVVTGIAKGQYELAGYQDYYAAASGGVPSPRRG